MLDPLNIEGQAAVTTHAFPHPIIGQEAVCPDGLGRVIAFKDDFPEQWVKVSTYVNDRQCKWAPANVQLAALPVAKAN